MKIGLFTDTYYPEVNGVANSVFILKRNLEKAGHEVFVFTASDCITREISWDKHLFRIASIPTVGDKRLALLHNRRWHNIISGLNLDIIHSHTEFTLGILGRSMARKLDIPYLHTYHTIYEDYTHHFLRVERLTPLAKKATRKMSAIYCNSANDVIVPTEKVKNLLESYGVYQDIHIIPTGIQLEKYQKENYSPYQIDHLKKELGIQPYEKVILFIGRIAKEKNIAELMYFLKEYLLEREYIKFVLIGDGPELNNLKELSKELALEMKILFLGEKPWDLIGHYYQLGDIFVSASQSETQGITYVEALTSGLPVVAKRDPCLNDVVIEGKNGFLYDRQDELISYVDLLLHDAEMRNKMAETACASGYRFSEQGFAQSVSSLYTQIVDRHNQLEGVESEV